MFSAYHWSSSYMLMLQALVWLTERTVSRQEGAAADPSLLCCATERPDSQCCWTAPQLWSGLCPSPGCQDSHCSGSKWGKQSLGYKDVFKHFCMKYMCNTQWSALLLPRVIELSRFAVACQLMLRLVQKFCGLILPCLSNQDFSESLVIWLLSRCKLSEAAKQLLVKISAVLIWFVEFNFILSPALT